MRTSAAGLGGGGDDGGSATAGDWRGRQLRLGFGLKWGAEASQATGRWPISNLGSRRLRGGSPVQICRGRLLPKIFWWCRLTIN